MSCSSTRIRRPPRPPLVGRPRGGGPCRSRLHSSASRWRLPSSTCERTRRPSDAANSVRAFGGAPDLGPASGLDLNSAVLDIAAHPGGNGYWLVSSDGGVFTFGDAQFFGSTGSLRLKAPVVGMAAAGAATATGSPRPTVACSPSATPRSTARSAACSLNSPILSITATPSGNGYWLTARRRWRVRLRRRRVPRFRQRLSPQRPIVAMAATPSGHGYYLLASDGGVFAFGDATFKGAAVDPTAAPSTGIAASRRRRGLLGRAPERRGAPVRCARAR